VLQIQGKTSCVLQLVLQHTCRVSLCQGLPLPYTSFAIPKIDEMPAPHPSLAGVGGQGHMAVLHVFYMLWRDWAGV